MNTWIRWGCLIAALFSVFFFADVAYGAASKGDWWGALAALASCVALVLFFGLLSVGAGEFGKTLYSVIAGVATVCGMFSLGSEMTNFRLDVEPQMEALDTFANIGAGQIRVNSGVSQRLAEEGLLRCAIQQNVDAYSLVSRTWETLNIGPAMTIFWGVAFEKPKPQRSCLSVYGELIQLDPNANQRMSRKSVNYLQHRLLELNK
ncbi:hypothetical protein [Comamonas sp.]|uniref:hypothetical protein n=1 Tax=Comamonas sp. TaxID=34028 RepID=UPI003A8EEB81